MSDERAERDGEGKRGAPPPATWAGRQSQEEGAAPGSAGLTDELERIERELGAELGAEGEPASGRAEGEPAPGPPGGEGEPALGPRQAEDQPAAEPPPEDARVPGPEAEPAPPSGQNTVEADTLALADREEAAEAALAAVRERAAAHGAGQAAPPVPPPPATPPSEAPPPAPAPRPAALPVGDPPSRLGIWARFAVASLVIVASMAAATAVSALVFVGGIAKELNPLHVGRLLDPVENAQPETFLILGSDKRSGEGDRGRSDTTILLRVDPDQNAIRLLSIPRDLKVNIKGVGVAKFNEAYTVGGPKLTLETVKQLTGLKINHIVNVDFLGFADAVNAIGCVYVDVDRHYYIPPNSGVAAIDIEAGYQRLCGLKALEYVRYRHTDNDLVRAARQQYFLQQARAQVPVSSLISPFSAISGKGRKLIDIFTKYTSSDIQGTDTLISMAKLMFAARHAQIYEIHFPAQLGGPTDPYVTASQHAIQVVVRKFLGEAPKPAPSKPAPSQPKPAKHAGKAKPPKEPAPPPPMDETSAGQPVAAEIWDHDLTRYGIYYPTRVPPGSEISPGEDQGGMSRSFKIDGPGDAVYHGYKIVISQFGPGYYQYFGVSGTDWKDAPILSDPTTTKTIDGRDYQLYYDGDRLQMVAFKTRNAAYWVTNDLLETASPEQMLSMATSLRLYAK